MPTSPPKKGNIHIFQNPDVLLLVQVLCNLCLQAECQHGMSLPESDNVDSSSLIQLLFA